MENLHELENLMKINSYSTNRRSANIKLDYLASLLQDLPLKLSRYQSKQFGDMMIIRTKRNNNKKAKIGLVLHYDTVYPEDRNFPIKQVGQKLYGPGAYDMQGSIFVVVQLLRKLHNQGKLRNLVVVLNSCEEKGSPDFQPRIRKIANDLDYAMVFEGRGKGKYRAGTKKFKRELTLVTARKGIFQQRITCSGPGGHSGSLSKIEERHNAISVAIVKMAQIEALADYDKGTTINLAYVNGGRENTVLAEECEFTFDVRYRFESERKRVKQGINKVVKEKRDKEVKTEISKTFYDLPPMQPSIPTQKFFAMVKKICEKEGYEVNEEGRGGWSDACNFAVYNPELMVLDGFGPKGDGEHSPEEFVYVDTLEETVEVCGAVVKEILNRR